MSRKLRIAAIGSGVALAIVAIALGAAYLAARHVRPFYEQALRLDHDALERGKQELESRATALYTDTRQAGKWQALFTDEQVNGWLALALDQSPGADGEKLSRDVREPRIAITPGMFTLGFTTTQGHVETVVSVDASVFITEQGDVAVRLVNVRAGALPLPVRMVADQIAAKCRELELPVLWTEQEGNPVAMISIRNADAQGRQLYVDAVQLDRGEVFVAGHTDVVRAGNSDKGKQAASAAPFKLDDYELRLSARSAQSGLEIGRRQEQATAAATDH